MTPDAAFEMLIVNPIKQNSKPRMMNGERILSLSEKYAKTYTSIAKRSIRQHFELWEKCWFLLATTYGGTVKSWLIAGGWPNELMIVLHDEVHDSG